MCVIVKTRYFYSFTINPQLNLKSFQHTIVETFTKKRSLRNLTRFDGGLFHLELLEIFTGAFLLKTFLLKTFLLKAFYYFNLKHCRAPSLKTKKNLLKKGVCHLEIAWQSKEQKKNIKKRERKTIK